MCHLAELAVEMEDRLVDWEEDLATGGWLKGRQERGRRRRLQSWLCRGS